jgi:hypothetical protein
MEQTAERTHQYSADATVIAGHLVLPFQQEIGRQAYTTLPAEGGYFSRRVEDFRLGEVIAVRSGYTLVAGNRSNKPGEGWSTLTTVVVEGLNVLEIVTADRIVGQILTDHPPEGHVPTISFLGTRFENLRIAGHPVKLELNLGILGPKPADDKPYGLDDRFKKDISDQYNLILESEGLPADKREQYSRLSASLGSQEEVECSLVKTAKCDFPGPCYGHWFHIPHFGWISLGNVKVGYKEVREKELTLRKTTVSLTMIDLILGCAVEGKAGVGGTSTNGQTVP